MKYWIVCLLLVLPLTASFAEDATKPDAQFKGEFIYLRDYGTDDIGYLSLPQEPPTAGIILVPDGHGIDSWLKITADVIAQKGYIVLVLDLYNGNANTEEKQVERMENDLMEKGVLDAMKTSTVFFQQSPRFKMDKVFVVGPGSMEHYLLAFAAQKKLSLNGLVVVNPSKPPVEDELKRVRYPVLFQLGEGSPVTSGLDAMVKNLGYQDLCEIKSVAKLDPKSRRLDEAQWQQVSDFMQKNSTEERKKGLLQSLKDIF
ncbi:MAG: dienelactone hydrolase family protein [Verrucomicrobiales bacterium]|jgi:carboxymethylenebutenolidase|nr:dienelactone hydrolase family protein [Verrucomicrobiales bacterium]